MNEKKSTVTPGGSITELCVCDLARRVKELPDDIRQQIIGKTIQEITDDVIDKVECKVRARALKDVKDAYYAINSCDTDVYANIEEDVLGLFREIEIEP